MKKIVAIGLFCLCGFTSQAQEGLPATSPNQGGGGKSKSVLVGGFATSESLLLLTKLGHEYRHLGFQLDLTTDHAWVKRPADHSKDAYHLYASAVSARYYLKPGGRSLFAEAGGGAGQAWLRTKDRLGSSTRKAEVLPLAGWGLGWRFGRRPKRLFGEVSYRVNYSLREAHLYTDTEAPPGSKAEGLSYHSWYFEKGKALPQLYLGIGFSF